MRGPAAALPFFVTVVVSCFGRQLDRSMSSELQTSPHSRTIHVVDEFRRHLMSNSVINVHVDALGVGWPWGSLQGGFTLAGSLNLGRVMN